MDAGRALSTAPGTQQVLAHYVPLVLPVSSLGARGLGILSSLL